MATTVAELVAKLSLNSDEFKRGTEEAGRIAARLGDGFKAVALAGTVMAGAVAAAGAAAFAMTKQIANQGDELYKMSQKIGISVEQLSSLKLAAELSDLSLQEFGMSIAMMSRRIQDFSDGSKESVEAWRRINLDPTQFKNTVELLGALAEKFSQMPDGAQKTALAMDLMGRSGAQMIPLLNQGKDALAAIVEESKRLGLTWTTENARAAEEFNDAITRLSRAFTGLKTTVFVDLLPVFQEFIDQLREFASSTEVRDWAVNLGKAFFDLAQDIKSALQFLNLIPETPADRLRKLREELARVNQEWEKQPWLTKQVNTFFGHEAVYRQRVADLQAQIADLEAGGVGQSTPVTRTLTTKSLPDRPRLTADEEQKRAMLYLKADLDAMDTLAKERAEFLIWDTDQVKEQSELATKAQTENVDTLYKHIEDLRQQESVSSGQAVLEDVERRKTARQNLLDAYVKQYEYDAQVQKEAADAVTKYQLTKLELLLAKRSEFDALFTGISGAFSTMLTGILQGTQTMEEAFRRMGQNILSTLLNDVIQRGLKAVQDALWDAMSPLLQETGGTSFWGSLVEAFASGAGSSAGATASVGSYAAGGVVTRPTFAMLGEGGESEAIVPLSRAGEFGFGSGGGGVTQNIIVNAGVPETVRREINALRPELRRDAVDALLEARNRGGGVAKSFGERQK